MFKLADVGCINGRRSRLKKLSRNSFFLIIEIIPYEEKTLCEVVNCCLRSVQSDVKLLFMRWWSLPEFQMILKTGNDSLGLWYLWVQNSVSFIILLLFLDGDPLLTAVIAIEQDSEDLQLSVTLAGGLTSAETVILSSTFLCLVFFDDKVEVNDQKHHFCPSAIEMRYWWYTNAAVFF